MDDTHRAGIIMNGMYLCEKAEIESRYCDNCQEWDCDYCRLWLSRTSSNWYCGSAERGDTDEN